jgi:fused signal recognition particle receptor
MPAIETKKQVHVPAPLPEAKKPEVVVEKPQVVAEEKIEKPRMPAPEVKKPIAAVERPPVRVEVRKPEPAAEKPRAPEVWVRKPAAVPAKEEEKRPMKVSLSLESKVKGLLLGEVEVKEKDIDDLLQELEMSMLEADVAYEVAQAVGAELKAGLVGKRIRAGEIQAKVKGIVREALRAQLEKEKPDLLKLAASKEKPFKILFVGPNGAGKTTTMAKVAELFMKNGKSVVFSASDSYRAAAIEQTEAHANKLGIKAIKHSYGADPAAVCFDAINYAKAHGIDVVLMDTAGRQETNRNLVDEMKKIARIAKPDMKIFVGESIAGNAIVEQVKSFNEAVGLDGVVLTKLDCDAKGGAALSVTKATGVPILYFGVGQGYDDLREFDADFLLSQLLE